MAAQNVKFLVLALCCCAVFADVQVNPLKFKDILYKSWSPPMQSMAQDSYDVSAECEAEINRLINSNPKTLETDVVMALDAFGKPPAGILQLNVAWLGHYDECMTIDGFNYCLIGLNVNTTKLSKSTTNKNIATSLGEVGLFGMKWGVCLPSNCSENDISAVLTHLLDALKVFESVNIPLDALEEQSVTCAKDPTIPYSAGVICTIILCGFIASLMIVGALYDEFLKLQAEKPLGPSLGLRIRRPWRLLDDSDEADDDDDVPILKDVGTAGPSINREGNEMKKQNLATRLLLCFALNRNLAKLMDTKQGDKTIGSLNGIRVISMTWVMLGHTLVFGLGSSDNLPTLLSWVKTHAGFQAIANAYFSVDSFFFLSGFLLAFLTFARFRELRSVKTWALFYFHRYWRLTPLLAFTILIWMYIPQFFGSGPLWQSSAARPLCSQYWWSDLLYINNFWPKAFEGECIAWTWYLANDMQFFIISPLLLAPLFYFPIFGWLALVATLIASFVSTGLIIGTNDLSVDLFGQTTQQKLPGADFSSMVYGKPYCRIAPYLVGIGLGYIMHRIGKRRVKMSPVLALLGWLAAAGLALSVVYGLYPTTHTPPMTKAANIVYGSVSRFVWALALAWVVFACKYGYGGWINTFLSWSAWVPLARVTFPAYLFHPIVIFVFYYNFASPFHFSVYLLAFYFAGVVSVSYLVAVLASLAIEYPFANLEKVLLPTPPRAKQLKDRSNPDTASTDVVTVVTGSPVRNSVAYDDSAYRRGVADSREVMS
ncbi:nose resistant to fluoxetine protein 6-like [Patiria miniata]|uniref:Nose resistant-to-fluoxetine protein N-terminal domain-containing protein n=1 Tax=Patiria miniata TaxID=46514 RepID=A0A914B464_PATMI|nr:nose resistant to fluoxetine protein 6-like [Patiria miniata]XP_038070286.1 nose resistant to fluoxetine protein 6-like [Patiria miniata]